jgi:hypothetical protein
MDTGWTSAAGTLVTDARTPVAPAFLPLGTVDMRGRYLPARVIGTK